MVWSVQPIFCHSDRSRSTSDGGVESLPKAGAEGNLLFASSTTRAALERRVKHRIEGEWPPSLLIFR